MERSEKQIALIGIGNILFSDEGLGAYLIKYIETNFHLPLNLTVIEGGTLGFGLMTYYQSYDTIILVGTGSGSAAPGTITVQDARETIAEGPVRKTANEVEMTLMLEICSFHEAMGEVTVISMIPEEINAVRNGLSSTILKQMPHLLERVRGVLAAHDVVLTPKSDEPVTFEAIIDAYANPRAPRL